MCNIYIYYIYILCILYIIIIVITMFIIIISIIIINIIVIIFIITMCIYMCVHLHVYSIGVQPSSPLNIEEKARQPLWKIVMVGDVSSHYQKHYFEGAILNAGFPPPTAQLQLYIRVARSPLACPTLWDKNKSVVLQTLPVEIHK